MSTDMDFAELEAALLQHDPASMTQMTIIKKEPAFKSIVNILADEVIKEAAKPARHQLTHNNSITHKSRTRRSNLRHALADEKSKKLLENDEKTSPVTKANL